MSIQPYRVVKLQKNRLYPTYQLFAAMANKKTSPQDGLKIAALTVLEWLRRRLGEDIPNELKLPGPEAYKVCTLEQLVSIHINAGFVIDVVSLPEDGVWSLQITEPDLGSDPGNPDQKRNAVPGRVIETDIGFRIVGDRLQCGFKTVISDVEGTAGKAEVYRLAVVKRLINNPDFGLKQILPLTPEGKKLTAVDQIKQLATLLRSPENQLPVVVFTYHAEETEPLKTIPDLLPEPTGMGLGILPGLRIENLIKPERKQTPQALLPYDADAFARSTLAFCRTYVLTDGLLERFCAQFNLRINRGDALLFEPLCFGGAVHTFSYKNSVQAREATLENLRGFVWQYPLGKTMDFGNVYFLTVARAGLVQGIAAARQQAKHLTGEWDVRFADMEAAYQEQLRIAESDNRALSQQAERQKRYAERLEREKEELRSEYLAERYAWQARLSAKDGYVSYLERRINRPSDHAGIARWVKRCFSERLVLHEKAERLLEDKSAKSVDLNLICDALDFLATDYWDARYQRLPKEDVLSRCSQKYGRPFEVVPTGLATIEYTPGQYKIKYFQNKDGKRKESGLDYHLRVGNDAENLLRIYFLHDDEKKLVVVGSLPRHLKTVSIQ